MIILSILTKRILSRNKRIRTEMSYFSMFNYNKNSCSNSSINNNSNSGSTSCNKALTSEWNKVDHINNATIYVSDTSNDGFELQQAPIIKASIGNSNSYRDDTDTHTGGGQLPPSLCTNATAKSSSYTPSKFQKQSSMTHTSASRNTSWKSSSSSKKKSVLPNTNDIVNLSLSQQRVLTAIIQKKSIFFTGSAGTGKSYVLKVLKDILSLLGMSEKVAFTAPTGVAACNVNGLTIHSWSGIGVGNVSNPQEVSAIVGNATKPGVAKKRWVDTDILIIDEISMLSAEFFDILSIVGQRNRDNNTLPFGGMQVVVCGDFFQLPPIGVGKNNVNFCYQSPLWKTMFGDGHSIVLDKVFRQKDPTFLNLLNELRRGYVSDNTSTILNNKVKEYQSNSNSNGGSSVDTQLKPTILFSTNKDVDECNVKELRGLDSSIRKYKCVEDVPYQYQKQMESIKAPILLELCVGAQVMLLKNLDTSKGLVNGARGVVRKFENADTDNPYEKSSNGSKVRDKGSSFNILPVVLFSTPQGNITYKVKEEDFSIESNDKILAYRTQLPLMLAWAISIHKSQGMTIPYLQVTTNGIFECGQAYVALTRATDLNGLTLTSFDPKRVRAHPSVCQFYRELGYTTESEHNEKDTISIPLGELADMFKSARIVTTDEVLSIERRKREGEWKESKHAVKQPSTVVKNKSGGILMQDEWFEDYYYYPSDDDKKIVQAVKAESSVAMTSDGSTDVVTIPSAEVNLVDTSIFDEDTSDSNDFVYVSPTTPEVNEAIRTSTLPAQRVQSPHFPYDVYTDGTAAVSSSSFSRASSVQHTGLEADNSDILVPKPTIVTIAVDGLTSEQKSRMEINRLKALERKENMNKNNGRSDVSGSSSKKYKT